MRIKQKILKRKVRNVGLGCPLLTNLSVCELGRVELVQLHRLMPWEGTPLYRNNGASQAHEETTLILKSHNSLSPCVSDTPSSLPRIPLEFFKKDYTVGPG